MSKKEFCSSESQAIGDMSGNKQGSTESTLGKKTSNENDIGDVNLSKAEKEYIGSQVECERSSTHDNEHDADEKSKREETGDVKIVTVEEHMVPEESADHGMLIILAYLSCNSYCFLVCRVFLKFYVDNKSRLYFML